MAERENSSGVDAAAGASRPRWLIHLEFQLDWHRCLVGTEFGTAENGDRFADLLLGPLCFTLGIEDLGAKPATDAAAAGAASNKKEQTNA
jgi:hypothetical protein